MNLGEFIIKIGTKADIKGLDETIKKLTYAEKKTKRQIQLIRDLEKATSEEEKELIKKNAAQQDEIDQLKEAKENHLALTNEINTSIMTAFKWVAAISTTVIALDRLGNSLLKNNQSFMTFERQTGMSIRRLNQVAGVAKMASMNMSTEQVASDLAGLQKKIFEFERFGTNSKTFGMLGINPRGMDSMQVIMGLRTALKDKNDLVKSYYLDELGLSQEWLHVLNLTNDKFKEYLKYATELQLTEEERKELAKYTADQQKNNMRWELAKQRLIKAVMPLTIKIMDLASKIALNVSNIVDAIMDLFNKNPIWLTVLRDALVILTGAAFARTLRSISSLMKLIGASSLVGGIGGLLGLGAGAKGVKAGAKGIGGLLGLGAGAKGLSKILAKNGTKFAARQGIAAAGGVATGGAGIPWIELALGIWALWDIGHDIFEWMQKDDEDDERDEAMETSMSTNNSYQYHTLRSNMTNNFYNNPQPATEAIAELGSMYNRLIAEQYR